MSTEIQIRPAGYEFIIEQFKLDVIPNWHLSFVSQSGTLHTSVVGDQVKTTYPASYWPGDSLGGHLEFAFRYDGINLGLLAALFNKIQPDEIVAWICSRPTGKYARRLWFLYEFLTGIELPIENLKTGNYIELLDEDQYFTLQPGRRIQRQRIINNLTGDRNYCPIVRKTAKLISIEAGDIRSECEHVLANYPQVLLSRALNYLYKKETKSSFQIENIKPSASRIERFIGLLEIAALKDYCTKPLLIDLQNRIVDPRFADRNYRTIQNYIGQSISFQKQFIHYICPRPDVVNDLMSGLINSHEMMISGGVPALIHAAITAYGFVFLHPFQDGNGRIHRFLIHNILSIRHAMPDGLILPVSATMLKHATLYDRSLESFSKPLMQLIEYDIDDLGHLTVTEDTSRFYRYIDMTAQAEALLDFVQLTIKHELASELDYLSYYDATKKAIQQIIDMPDQKIDLFILLCLQNEGRLSLKKRESHFQFLTDEEVVRLETAVREGYRL